MRARRRYHRVATPIPSRPSRPHVPSSGSTTSTATRRNSPCTTETTRAGPASRRAAPMRATSVVPRVMRSPVLARSTTVAGSARTRSRNCSRMRCWVRSPNRRSSACACRVRISCARAATPMPAASRLTESSCVPRPTSSMMRPSSHGLTRPAAAASPVRPTVAATMRSSSRSSSRAARRTWLRLATGRYPGAVPPQGAVIGRPSPSVRRPRPSRRRRRGR